MKKEISILTVLEALLSIAFAFVGLINLIWGNDQFFGLFIIVIALVFITPFRRWIKKITGIWITIWLRILIALFIVWSSMGVGELPEKIDLMIEFFNKKQTN
jgi:MFS superfamily sulfate permease-like transporter